MPEWRYEGLAHLCANIPMNVELPEILVGKVKAGEHMNLILQALCRASVRRSIGDQCAPCNAYIIVAKKSGIRTLLPRVFPGCKLGTWRPVRRKLKGKVADAVAYVRCFFAENPDGVLPLLDLRKALGMSDISNFNKTIRRHSSFMAVLEDMQAEEVMAGKGRKVPPINHLCDRIALKLFCKSISGHLVLLASKITKQGVYNSRGYSFASEMWIEWLASIFVTFKVTFFRVILRAGMQRFDFV